MKPREVLEQLEKGRFDRKLSDIASTNIDPEDAKLLKEDCEYWVEHMPKVNYVYEALKEELGEGHFDLMFDRGAVFEGRAVRVNPDRGLFQGWGAFGGGIAQPNARVTDIADDLAAIKYLVFVNKKITMAELMDALKANWEGKEELREMCLNAPKYGNDDDYVDDIFNHISLKTQEILSSRPDPFTGQKPFLFKGAAAGHVTQGASVGALPNGRRAGTPLNDAATSAMPGVDVKGPTALINSATKVPHAWEMIGHTHNMKLSKSLLSTREKLEKVSSLVKTFIARGGWHIQFNIHSLDSSRPTRGTFRSACFF